MLSGFTTPSPGRTPSPRSDRPRTWSFTACSTVGASSALCVCSESRHRGCAWHQATAARVAEELKAIPDARVTFQSQQGGGGRDLTLYVVGSNPVLAEQTARTLVEPRPSNSAMAA